MTKNSNKFECAEWIVVFEEIKIRYADPSVKKESVSYLLVFLREAHSLCKCASPHALCGYELFDILAME